MAQPTTPHRNGQGAPEAGRQAPTQGRGARPVPLDRLCAAGPAAALDFETTAEVAPMDGAPGQDRAEEALRFALAMPHEGYNAFVLGSPGAGRRHLVRRVLAEIAPTRPTPPDQVTLQNFEDSRRPLALQLAAGRAVALKADLDQLVNELVTVVPAALSGEPLQAQRATLEASLEDRQDAALAPVRSLAESLGIAVLRSPEGFVLAPRSEEAVLSAEEVAALPSETRRTVEQAAIKVREAMARALGPAEEWVREHRQALTALDQAAARAAAAPPVSALKAQWAEAPRLCTWLDALLEDVVQNAERLSQDDEDESPAALLLGEDAQDPVQAWTRRYRAHILVDHANTVGAPIVWEEDPTLSNLSGRVEHRTRLGTLVTDASLIRPGALHRANGGCLVLDAHRVLSRPMAWEYLEQALRSRRVQIRALSESLGLVATESLDPEPLALDLKVVLVGERQLFYTLSDIDPEFTALFKVPVDFEDDVDRAPADELRFVRLVASLIQKDRLRPFHRDAVARVLRQASRQADDQRRLSAHIESIQALLREADHFAGQQDAPAVRASHVVAALDAAERRVGRVRDRLRDGIVRGVVNIATDGMEVGEINALVVVQLGPSVFGHPTRVSARVRPGRGQLVDIEREVRLGGPLHSKGVLIISSYIGARYGMARPLSFHASLVFEQSYGQVDGDSASLAETCALLSALAEVPLRQDLAVTGSIDQRGRVQAIGGVNEKVEGFFSICAARGLTGRQGVLLPADNLDNLMLHDDVVQTITDGRFHLWSIETVDDALALLTDLPTGPEGSFETRLRSRLERMSAAVAPHGDDDGEG